MRARRRAHVAGVADVARVAWVARRDDAGMGAPAPYIEARRSEASATRGKAGDGLGVNTVAVLTSGGDAPGMNAAVRAVVRRTIFRGGRPIGVQRGFAGLSDGAYAEMYEASVGDIIQRGGTVLQTARFARLRDDPGEAAASAARLRAAGVDGLVVIGGNGSLHGAWTARACRPSPCPRASTTTFGAPMPPSASTPP
jgi:hypothetical protein